MGVSLCMCVYIEKYNTVYTGQPGLVVGEPAHIAGGVETRNYYSPFQPRTFYDSMI